MPSADGFGTLHVSGKCKFPASGYSAELRPKHPQGINPRIYILVRDVHAPLGRAKPVESVADVRYKERISSDYDIVHILPDAVDVKIEKS
jgi:hypothetical protein